MARPGMFGIWSPTKENCLWLPLIWTVIFSHITKRLAPSCFNNPTWTLGVLLEQNGENAQEQDQFFSCSRVLLKHPLTKWTSWTFDDCADMDEYPLMQWLLLMSFKYSFTSCRTYSTNSLGSYHILIACTTRLAFLISMFIYWPNFFSANTHSDLALMNWNDVHYLFVQIARS